MTNGIVNMMYVLQRLGVTVLLAAVLSAASLSPLQAQEASVNCDSGGQGLQKKIDSASHGAEIFISGACTDGPFFIRKDLKLIGDGFATLSAAGGSSIVLLITGATVEVSDVTIDASGTGTALVVHGSSIELTRVTVRNASNNGVTVDLNSSASIRQSTIENNGTGIFVTRTSNAAVNDSTIQDNSDGIGVEFNSSVAVGNSMIKNNVRGVFLTRMSSGAMGGKFRRGEEGLEGGGSAIPWLRLS